jgi:NADP-dependent 3-hydroxy acid dehydrogenase YdfG
MSMPELKGRVVLVTAAASGFGRSTVRIDIQTYKEINE